MLSAILQITAGFSICLALTKDFTKSVALAPLIGAIFLAAVSPIIDVRVFVVMELFLLLVVAKAVGKIKAEVKKSLLLIFIIYVIVVAANLYSEPYVASWFNQDEPFHLMNSKLYAVNGTLHLDYPFLVHMIGGACYKLDEEWYFWYRVVLALLIPSEGALIYMIAEELKLNPVIVSLFYLLMNPSIIHLFEIGTYSNELLDPLILLDLYLLLRDRILPASLISFIIPISNTIGWIFLAYIGAISLITRSKRILSVLPSAIWLFLPLSVGRAQTYASLSDVVPLSVKLILLGNIPLDIWSFFGASFSLGFVGLFLRNSWEEKRKFLSLYAVVIFSVLAFFAIRKPSLCWRFILLLPPSLSISASCLLDKLCSLTRVQKLAFLILVLILPTSPPMKGTTPYQDNIPFVYNICKEYKGVNISSYGVSSFPSVFGCSVVRIAALEDLLLDGSRLIITRKTELERIIVEKDECIRVISSSKSADLIEYIPRWNQSVEGIYMGDSLALVSSRDAIVVTTVNGAICKVVKEDPLVVKCPYLDIRKVIVFRSCYLPQLVELKDNKTAS